MDWLVLATVGTGDVILFVVLLIFNCGKEIVIDGYWHYYLFGIRLV